MSPKDTESQSLAGVILTVTRELNSTVVERLFGESRSSASSWVPELSAGQLSQGKKTANELIFHV